MFLNTEKKNTTIWLAKVPKYLGEQILKAKKDSKVGTLTINRNDDGTATVQISLANQITKSGIPSEHIIDVKDKNPGMFLISEYDKNMSVQGFVNKECFIRPVMNNQYLEYKRKVNLMNKNMENEVKVIDTKDFKKTSKYSSIKEMDILARKRKEMLQNKKRERLEKDDVIEILFNAFEKHDLWTVKDLADFSGQPVAFIQEIVSEICVLNKKDHKNTYELKPEYKQYQY